MRAQGSAYRRGGGGEAMCGSLLIIKENTVQFSTVNECECDNTVCGFATKSFRWESCVIQVHTPLGGK